MPSEQTIFGSDRRGWNRVIGQERVKGLLKRAVEGEQVAHAYLFVGDPGIGTDALALEFARVLNCAHGKSEACDDCPSCSQMDRLQHPNVRIVFPLPVGKNEKEGDDPVAVLNEDQIQSVREAIATKAADYYADIRIPRATTIKINSVRDIRREASLSRAASGRNVFVILRGEEMNDAAANSLLKTLEEPSGDTVLLLTATEKDALLPTIVSRCQIVQCERLTDDEIETALLKRDGASDADAHLAAQMAGGSFRAAREVLSSDVRARRHEVVAFVRAVLSKKRLGLLEDIERLSSDYDRASLQPWLRLLAGWLRDAMLLREGLEVHASGEDLDALTSFASRFSSADLPRAVSRTERAIADLDKNLYLPSLLASLAIDLRTVVTGSSSPAQ